MKIEKEETKYYKYKFTYDFSLELLEFCRWLKQKVGWRNMGFFEKAWRFSSINIITVIKNKYPGVEVDDDVLDDFQELKLAKEKELLDLKKLDKIKNKKTSDIEIKGLKMELYPYQKVGVEFFENNKGKAILADTMGLGKTATSIAYLVYAKMDKTVVICPASVKYAWENEIKKWSHLKPFVIDSRSDLTKEVFLEHDVFIINYDIVKKFFDFFSYRFDCLILDEFHYIKNSQAQRTKLVKQFATKIPSKLLLSGTPLLSRPSELYNGLNMLDPLVWSNWMNYTKRYCGGHQGYFGYDYRGATNIDELQAKIGKYFLRRKKEEVLPDLPPKRFIDIPVKMDSETEFNYSLAMGDFMEYLKDVKNKTDKEIKKTMQAEKLVRLGELRRITSEGKLKAAEEIISNIIEGGEKLIVFSCYSKPLEVLKEKFDKVSVMLNGQTPESMRQPIIDSFQKNSNVKIFFGGIKSAGVGITLTEASSVLFLDFSWVPADHSQAIDRAHRIGTTAESVSVYQLYCKDTIDDQMRELLDKKQELFNQLIDDPITAKQMNTSMVNDLVKSIELSTSNA